MMLFWQKLKPLVRRSAALSFPSIHWFRTPLRKIRYRLRNCPLYFYRRRGHPTCLRRRRFRGRGDLQNPRGRHGLSRLCPPLTLGLAPDIRVRCAEPYDAALFLDGRGRLLRRHGGIVPHSAPDVVLRRQRDGNRPKRGPDLEFSRPAANEGHVFRARHRGRRLPAVVRRIAAAGHEIGSHSAEHRRLYNLDRAEIKQNLFSSKKLLEDVAVVPVAGFRAPDFSINRQTLFILDLLLEAGYTYDSSLYPTTIHDVYGVPNTNRFIHRLPSGLIEYPLSTFKFGKWSFPALGGGYFRLYPLALTRHILRRMQRAGHPAMFYIHPYEFGRLCPDVPGLSALRRFRHMVNRTKTRARFASLFREFKFGRVDDTLCAGGVSPPR